MKPRIFVVLALYAPTLAGCAGFGFGGESTPAKPAAAAAATPPQAAQPIAPVVAVQAQPLPPTAPDSTASIQPAPAPRLGVAAASPQAAPPTPAVTAASSQPGQSPASTPTGAALGGVLGGPIGASLTEADRRAAWNAQIAALDSGQSRSWRGVHGVFGFIAPGTETGGSCRAYSQTIYIAGRPNRGQGVACKQADGTWKMTS